ncbi:MAG: cytochrome c oxidase assembly protein [Planctomycetes bacterium]|nr:cytochrome c oxidase assembly protein [Planctomycetota bacterium]
MERATLWSAWSVLSPFTLVAILLLALYWRGWRRLHHAMPQRWSLRHALFFSAGIAAMWIALQSPIDAMASWLLSAHMTQHFLLTMIAPPLLLLGWPMSPLLAGLPRWMSRDGLGPLLAWPRVQKFGRGLTHPVTGWLAMVLLTWGWHLPVMYQLALEVPALHIVEHACFLWGGLLFWWCVVEPYPWRNPWPRWAIPVYLLSADMANTIVAAVLAFASGAIYPWYEATAPTFGVTALADQQAAAAIMWIPGQLVYLVPAAVIMFNTLSRPRTVQARSFALPILQVAGRRRKRSPFDAIEIPLLGAILKSANARGGLRWVMFAGAAAICIDGWLGPREASTNLAGTWTWTHWRGLTAVSMIAVGNLACMACPLIAPRNFLRRWITPRFRWPRAISTKWIALALIGAWLLCYEIWSLWDSSFATAWIIAGYFMAATAIDLLFEGASFCKWICPIGQYQMAMSTASPMEVRIRAEDVCQTCQTHDCLRGNASSPGCGTGLFLPKKVGNLDCTFCLDCVSACPHDNIGLLTRVPFAELVQDRWRSSIGLMAKRADFAALLAMLAVGAFANALTMTEPMLEFVAECSERLGSNVIAVIAVVIASMALIALPLLIAAGIGSLMRKEQFRIRFAHLTLELLPLAIAMWVAHLGFHLATGFRSAWPPLQRAMLDMNVSGFGEPQWSANCCAVMPSWLLPAQLCLLGAGLLVSMTLVWIRSERSLGLSNGSLPRVRSVAALAWCELGAALAWWMLGAWIVLQPMQMRGLIPS